MSSIIIPFLEKDGVTEVAEVFADELPLDDADFNGLIDVLRSELCPLKVWRDCALEYYRQGFKEGFDVMLHEIVESLAHPDVDKHYKKERDDFNEKMADIFNSLAARGLSTLLILKSSSSQVNESEVETLPRKIVEYLRRAEEYVRVNEFTWLLRGFYEISQGELKRAEDTLNAICLRANKDISKRKYSFGAFLGLAVVHFNKQNYNSCLDFLNKSISSNSFCESSCYVALSSCYQMLRQYDKAKLAIDKALDLEPTNVNALATAATLEQALAKTEKSKKKEHLLMANDYCMTALSIDGKAFQMLGKIDDALEYYKHSISNNPNMTVAQFEAAKILFSRREFRDALDLFNQIKSKHEDDKDTTEVATSFQFEPDLWLIQAILRQGNLSEQLIALKCYHHALDLLEQADTDVHHIIYTNMSSLYHSLGKLPQSLKFEGVFYEWKDIPIECHKVDELGIIKFVLSNIGTFKLEAYLHIGDDIRLNDVICKVQQIARILEDMGSTKAATELHIELLKCHPSYIECYIRLSNICKGMGKYDEASLWLSRASAVDDSNSDLLTCQGDLYSRSSHWNEAKKSYEKIISKNKHDARSMVSLGNFYLKNFNVDDKQEKNLKDSYKFYYHALNENKRNIFAAVGLGIVCSEKGKYDSAKEIFTRSRELLTSNCTNSEDITTNLGIVFFKQQKYFDAENIFLSSIKIAVKNIYHYDKIESLYNYAALTQFNQKKYKDSVKSLQKLINFNPSNSSFWFNLAISKSNFSTDYLNNVEQVYVSDNLVDAFDEFKFAVKILKFLTVSTFASKNMDKNQIKKFNKDCMGNFIIFSNSIQIAEAKKLELLKGPSLDTNTIQRNHAEAPVDTSIQGEIFNEKLVNNPEIRDAEEDNDINGNNTAVVNTKRNLDSEDSGSFKKVKIDLSSTDC
eukprot:gene19023-24843_t